MGSPVVRPTIAADLIVLKQPLPHPSQGITLLQDGEVLAVGGVMRTRSLFIAWAEISDRARKHPVALHKAARAFHKQLQQQGIRRLFAVADSTVPAAERWLERHGFVYVGTSPEGLSVFRWDQN